MKQEVINKIEELRKALMDLEAHLENLLTEHSEDWQDTDEGEECVGNIHYLRELETKLIGWRENLIEMI